VRETTRQDVEEYLSGKGWAWKERGGEFILDCCFCGKANHLYIAAETGLFSCKVCGRAGNLYQMRQELGDVLAVTHLQHAAPRAASAPVSRPKGDLPSREDWAKAEGALWAEEPDAQRARKHLLEDRKLSESTVREARIGLLSRWGKAWIAIPYIRKGELASVKMRSIPPDAKAFARVEGAPSLLYGAETLTGKEEIVLVEGELDVLAMREYGQTAVASTSLGARGWAKEWNAALESAKTILLAYDQDEEGEAGAVSLAQKLGTARCLRVRLPRKDVGDCLRDLIPGDVINAALRDAAPVTGPRVRPLAEFASSALNDAASGRGETTPWEGLTNLIGGIRRGDLNIITGKTGEGKSTWLVNLAYKRSQDGKPTLFFPSEQRPADVFRKVAASIIGGSWFDATGEQRTDATDKIAGLPLYVIDHRGEVDPEELHAALHYAVTRLMVQDVMLDHLHFFWPIRGGDSERTDIGTAVKTTKTWAQDLGITIWLVVQPGKVKGEVTVDDLRGSAELQQTPDLVIVVRRDRKSVADQTVLAVEKCRHEAGKEGKARLIFDRASQSYSDPAPGHVIAAAPPVDSAGDVPECV
jgi:twinkle protein